MAMLLLALLFLAITFLILSETGEKYHSIPNYGKINPDKATETTVSEAEAKGYEFCTKCW